MYYIMHALKYCIYSIYGSFVICYACYALLFPVWTAAHNITPCKCCNSKDNPHNNKNEMSDWHFVVYILYIVTLFNGCVCVLCYYGGGGVV